MFDWLRGIFEPIMYQFEGNVVAVEPLHGFDGDDTKVVVKSKKGQLKAFTVITRPTEVVSQTLKDKKVRIQWACGGWLRLDNFTLLNGEEAS